MKDYKISYFSPINPQLVIGLFSTQWLKTTPAVDMLRVPKWTWKKTESEAMKGSVDDTL